MHVGEIKKYVATRIITCAYVRSADGRRKKIGVFINEMPFGTSHFTEVSFKKNLAS